MYEKAEVTLVGDEVEAVKNLLKERIMDLRRLRSTHLSPTYVSVLDKIVEATREVK